MKKSIKFGVYSPQEGSRGAEVFFKDIDGLFDKAVQKVIYDAPNYTSVDITDHFARIMEALWESKISEPIGTRRITTLCNIMSGITAEIQHHLEMSDTYAVPAVFYRRNV